MAQDFFNDSELETFKKNLGTLSGDLQMMQARAHDFSKQRMRKRLEGINGDLRRLINQLPAEAGDNQSQGEKDGSRT